MSCGPGFPHEDLTAPEVHVPGYAQASDPGAVGAGKLWVDTSGGLGAWVAKIRNATDDGWEVVGAAPGVISHFDLVPASIGVNTHAQIDNHIADGTIHFTEASISHLSISDIGANTHAQIDSHISDLSIHFPLPLIDYAYVSANDAATDITGAELEELSDGSVTTLHSHPVSSSYNLDGGFANSVYLVPQIVDGGGA